MSTNNNNSIIINTNNTNSPIIPITITSTSTPVLSSLPSTSPSSNVMMISSPPVSYYEQGRVFITNNNNNTNVNVGCELGLETIGETNGLIVVGSNDPTFNESNQQERSITSNYFTTHNQNSSSSEKTDRNQLLGINSGSNNSSNDNLNDDDNGDDGDIEDNEIIVPAQHYQQPIESNNNDANNLINQNHQIRLQFQQLQSHHHPHISRTQLATKNSVPNLHNSPATVYTNKMAQRSMPNMQLYVKARNNNDICDIGGNNNINYNNDVAKPIFMIDNVDINCFNSLSTPNTPTFPPREQSNHYDNNNNNNRNHDNDGSNSFNPTLLSSSTTSGSLNQAPRKGHLRKRSLSAPIMFFPSSTNQNSVVAPSPLLSSSLRHHHHHHNQYHNYPNNIHHHHHHHHHRHNYPSISPFVIRKSNALLPIQIQRNTKNSQSTPLISSEEYQRKLNEELEKVDFDDITVSELKELLRQRGKLATGKKAVLMQRLQEEIELIKAMKNNVRYKGSGGDGDDDDDGDGNSDTGNNYSNIVNTKNNNDNNDQQRQQQQMIITPTLESSNFSVLPTTTTLDPTITTTQVYSFPNNRTFNPYVDNDVPFLNDNNDVEMNNNNNNITANWSDVNSPLLQQNVDDINSTISQRDFFFQHQQQHFLSSSLPSSSSVLATTRTEFDFTSFTNKSHNDTSDNNNNVINVEKMSNLNNVGNACVDDYGFYNQQQPPSSPPLITTDFDSLDNPHVQMPNSDVACDLSNEKTLTSSIEDCDVPMMSSSAFTLTQSSTSTTSSLLNDPTTMAIMANEMFASSPQHRLHHHDEKLDTVFQFVPQNQQHRLLNYFNNNVHDDDDNNKQQQKKEENMMIFKTEEDNLGFLNYSSAITPHDLTQQSNHIPIPIKDIDMSY